ncbi:MAG TPA: glycoside hydrolase family 15 protein [Myxococcota bacterium]
MTTLDHGVIGNGRILALVSPTSAVEWLCMPRFDSPSVFGRLLDKDKGGTFRFLVDGEEQRGLQSYVPNTNVLRTVFEGKSGTFEVIDFCPRHVRGLGVEVPVELVRILRPLTGAPRICVDIDPRPDYARVTPTVSMLENGLAFDGGGRRFHLQSNLSLAHIEGKHEFTLRSPIFFTFTCSAPDKRADIRKIDESLEETVAGWRAWAKTCALPTFAPEWVLRSALCLKLHAYEDTGAIIAATTTSVPEAMGTERTWDYRYCWLRDAAFVVEALRRLSQLREGERFIKFLRDVCDDGPLTPLVRVDGRRDLHEEKLEHLAGYGGNGHVRIGNAAAEQRQNDLNGELVLCLATMLTDLRIVHDNPRSFMPLVERLVDGAIEAAPQPDTSIWEFRTHLRHYTFSRTMCWAAVDRGARLARAVGRGDLADRWGPIAQREREIILARGYSQRHGFFTQTLDGDFADASNLLMPTLGIIDGRDPRFLSTLDAYEVRLAKNGLLRRYVNEDDFGETTSAFTLCSFWWAEALALAGRLDEAITVFNRVVAFANPLRLFSEDIEPSTGTLLGNYPQAYTHVGLIHAAMTISDLLEARDGRVRAWMMP